MEHMPVDDKTRLNGPLPNSVKQDFELELYRKAKTKVFLCHTCLSGLCPFGNCGNKSNLDI